MSNGVRFRLAHADGVEVQPLWFVLAVIRKNGYRTLGPKVRSGLNGQFFLATAVYVGNESTRSNAMSRICSELGAECTQPDLALAAA